MTQYAPFSGTHFTFYIITCTSLGTIDYDGQSKGETIEATAV